MRRILSHTFAVALGLGCAWLLHPASDALLDGEYPLFPYFVGTLATLAVSGVPAAAVTLLLGFLLVEVPVARAGQSLAVPRLLTYWACGVVTLSLVYALGRTRERVRRLADEAQATADEAEQWQSLIDTLLESAPVGIGLFDREFRILRVNQALATMHHKPAHGVEGRRVADVSPRLDPVAHEAFQRVLRTGAPVSDVEIQSGADEAGTRRYWRASLYPVRAYGDPVYAVAGIVEEVTQQRETLRRLRESEERYRSLVAATTAIVCVADAGGRILAPQPGWEAYTGQRYDEYCGHGFVAALHPQDRARAAAAWLAALDRGVVYEQVARVWHQPSRAYRHCNARAVPVRNPDGAIREWVGSITDVHDATIAEATVRRSEARFREMANLLPDGVWTARADGTLDYYNQHWLEYVGMTLDDAMKRGWRPVVHPDDLDRAVAAWTAAHRTGTPLEIEVRQRRHDGCYRWFLCRAVPVRDEHGTVQRWLGTATDIDDKIRAEEALIADRDVVESINLVGRALSAELDLDNVLRIITDATAKLLGAAFGAFVPAGADGVRGFVLPAGPDGDMAARLAALRDVPGVRAILGERRVVRERDAAVGVTSPVPIRSLLAAPVVSPAGDHFGSLVFGHARPEAFEERDERLLVGLAAQASIAIENARLYAAERRSRGAAEAANRAKDEFLSMLSHELRTPLTAMLTWVRLLREGRVSPDREPQALETIDRSGWALARIVDDLLDVSRIVTGRTRLELRDVALRDVLATAAATIRPTAETKQVSLDVRLGPDAASVTGDAGRLQQVVWNLLANAVRFTPSGGRVELALDVGTRTAEIVVRDTGAGIPDHLLPYVFDRFRQGHSAAHRQHGGLGLGLAIVRHFVELHGGQVRAESPGEGCGATFVVTLPRGAAAETATVSHELFAS